MPSTSFDTRTVTGGKFTPVSGTVMDLGCTGSLSGATETRTITKMCEGVPQKQVTVPLFMNIDFSGHLFTEVYRKLFGMKADAVVLTKWSYGKNSINGIGLFEWTALNMEGTEKKIMTFPNATVNAGFSFSYENGVEEISEVDLTIKAMPDAITGEIYTETISVI